MATWRQVRPTAHSRVHGSACPQITTPYCIVQLLSTGHPSSLKGSLRASRDSYRHNSGYPLHLVYIVPLASIPPIAGSSKYLACPCTVPTRASLASECHISKFVMHVVFAVRGTFCIVHFWTTRVLSPDKRKNMVTPCCSVCPFCRKTLTRRLQTSSTRPAGPLLTNSILAILTPLSPYNFNCRPVGLLSVESRPICRLKPHLTAFRRLQEYPRPDPSWRRPANDQFDTFGQPF